MFPSYCTSQVISHVSPGKLGQEASELISTLNRLDLFRPFTCMGHQSDDETISSLLAV